MAGSKIFNDIELKSIRKVGEVALLTQVGTLVPVEPLDDAYTGPLFTLWEGLYRRSTIPVGALCVPCWPAVQGVVFPCTGFMKTLCATCTGCACMSPMEPTRDA